LKPGGLFFLGVPNCVFLRKRITVPLGKWSSMDEWYERETFGGHIREPDVGHLRYIARDLGLGYVRVFGRNWLGYASRHGWARRSRRWPIARCGPFPLFALISISSAGHDPVRFRRCNPVAFRLKPRLSLQGLTASNPIGARLSLTPGALVR
jgi:hypothetical protein